MKRPRITKKVLSGLGTLRSLTVAEMEAGWLSGKEDKKEYEAAEAAINYIDQLTDWYNKKVSQP